MRRISALGICVIALLVAGAVPASASSGVNLVTKAGGVAQAGTPARLVFSVEAKEPIYEGCAASVTGSLAVNGAPRDRVTFPPAEVAATECDQGVELTGVVSALELTSRGWLKVKASLTFKQGSCVYSVGKITELLNLPTPMWPEIYGVSAKKLTRSKTCFRQEFRVGINLDDAQNGELFEAVRA